MNGSGMPLPRCLEFARDGLSPSSSSTSLPFALLLVPNFVYNKEYYKSAISEASTHPFYIIPERRYSYHLALHERGKAAGENEEESSSGCGDETTSPFFTMWYCSFGPGVSEERRKELIRDIEVSRTLRDLELRIARDIEEIPNDVRDITDKAKKRLSSKRRAAEKKKKKMLGGPS